MLSKTFELVDTTLPLVTRTRALGLEKVNRLILQNHLETCFSEAVNEGRGHAAIAELMDAVKFSPVLTGAEATLAGAATGEVAHARRRKR